MKKLEALIQETNQAEIAARIKMDKEKEVYIAVQQEWADIRQKLDWLCNMKHLAIKYGIDLE